MIKQDEYLVPTEIGRLLCARILHFYYFLRFFKSLGYMSHLIANEVEKYDLEGSLGPA